MDGCLRITIYPCCGFFPYNGEDLNPIFDVLSMEFEIHTRYGTTHHDQGNTGDHISP